MSPPVVHCWEEGPQTGDGGPDTGSSCLLPNGHEGPHEFTPDSQITITFAVMVPLVENGE